MEHGVTTYRAAAWAFRRLLGLVYLFAFASLAVQIVGLAGPGGIEPSGASAAALRAACWGGVALSGLLVAGVAPAVVLLPLWGLYLWLSRASGVFLAFQWDTLLLETGLLAAFVAPWRLVDRWRDAPDPPLVGRALMSWLLFRLLFESGLVKLASGDPTWRNLSALSYHFWTQPLPTPLAWYAAQLPRGVLRAATAASILVELVLPFAVLPRVPRRARVAACAGLVGLQALIALTGNYAFFNLLAAALCLWLLDDRALARLVPARWRQDGSGRRAHPAQAWLLVAFAVVTVPVSVARLTAIGGVPLAIPPVRALDEAIAPLRSVNGYGLFAVMTTDRPEIVVQGSNDGVVWLTYEFKYMPSATGRPLSWVAPHQPRLDWQLWFAALGQWEDEPWFQDFLARLLEGSPDVLDLLALNPFPDGPPHYVRADLYRYRFSTPEERQKTGDWWVRRRLGPYTPVFRRCWGADAPGRWGTDALGGSELMP